MRYIFMFPCSFSLGDEFLTYFNDRYQFQCLNRNAQHEWWSNHDKMPDCKWRWLESCLLIVFYCVFSRLYVLMENKLAKIQAQHQISDQLVTTLKELFWSFQNYSVMLFGDNLILFLKVTLTSGFPWASTMVCNDHHMFLIIFIWIHGIQAAEL